MHHDPPLFDIVLTRQAPNPQARQVNQTNKSGAVWRDEMPFQATPQIKGGNACVGGLTH